MVDYNTKFNLVNLFSIYAEFEYHAFIIYSKEDSHWVTGKLLPLLEQQHHLKCCVHYRDFAPGKPFQDSMAESVYNSYKVIAVLSINFLKSNYCSYELNIAKYRLLNRRDDSLVIIRIDNEDCRKLPKELRKRNFIDYSNPLERPLWKHRVLRFLGVPDDYSDRGKTVKVNCENIDSSSGFPIISGNPSRHESEEVNSAATTIKIVNQTRAFFWPCYPYYNSSKHKDGEAEETWLRRRNLLWNFA